MLQVAVSERLHVLLFTTHLQDKGNIAGEVRYIFVQDATTVELAIKNEIKQLIKQLTN